MSIHRYFIGGPLDGTKEAESNAAKGGEARIDVNSFEEKIIHEHEGTEYVYRLVLTAQKEKQPEPEYDEHYIAYIIEDQPQGEQK
jgi:hypothetical protein